jgi:hypothetical protein
LDTKINPKRLYKLAARDTNSRHVEACMTGDDDSVSTARSVRSSKNFEANAIKNAPIDKERVSSLEGSIVQHLSGKVSGIRNTMKKLDLSRSGVINFDEFNAAMTKHGIVASKPQLREMFQECAVDLRGRGNVNNHETWSNDIRYSGGKALDIENFIEKLASRASDNTGIYVFLYVYKYMYVIFQICIHIKIHFSIRTYVYVNL